MTKFRFAALCTCAAVLAVCVHLLAIGSGSGSISFGAFETAYTQNFNTLASSGTSNVLPAGWFIDESGSSANVNGSYNTSNGSTNAGDVYSFGATGSSDRALGTLRSGTLVPIVGASFTNNTGGTVASLDISYTGEQWRVGAIGRGPDRIDFQYSLDATSLTTGTWINVDALDFTSPDPGASGSAGLRDGNAPGFRSTVATQVAGLGIPVGGTIWIRWTDFDVTNADDGLGVDDFAIVAHQSVGPTGVGSASPNPTSAGSSTALTVVVTPGNPPAPIDSVTVDLTAIGGAASVPMNLTGPLTYTLTTLVATNTPGGTKTLQATILEQAPTLRTGIATISLSLSPTVLTIHQIQGTGTQSPYATALVETEGVVTALRFNNGYFMQMPDAEADGDSTTSEGIFVFTGNANIPPAAAIGNRVRVVGTVQEFRGDQFSPPQTEISGNPTTILLGTGQPLPAPITITAADTDPGGPIEQLERLEGMRVHVDALHVVAPTQGTVSEAAANGLTNGVYFGVIPPVARPFREPGVQVPDGLPAGSPCCVDRFDANPERIRVDSNGQVGFGANDTTEVMTGAVVSAITGVLDYSSRAYTILPDFGAQGTVSGIHGYTSVGSAAAHRFTIATANLERFFDTVDNDGISDVALTPDAYAKRLTKAALQICDVMRAPDIIGVEEVENLAVLQSVADAANTHGSCGGTQYAAYLFEGNDPGGIDDGFLVNLNHVVVRDVHQEGKDATFVNPNTNQLDLLNDRPPTVLRATITIAGSAPRDLTVIANHLRSLNGVEDLVDSRVRVKRLKQAEYLGHLIETLQTGPGAEPVVAVGDFNAFEFSDGYVDVIGTIKGTPVASDHVILASTDVPNTVAPLTDLVEADQTANRYSYVFDGSAQSLDHLLATQAAAAIFDHVEWGHSNADFPETLRGDETRPERLSDHDPVVAYFVLAAQTTTTVTATPNPADVLGDVTFTASVQSAEGPVTTGSIHFSDGGGFSATAAVVNGSASVVTAALPFGVGTHSITADFSDGSSFAPSSGIGSFVVADLTPPPVPLLSVTPNALWPVNHRMIGVTVTAASIDAFSGPAACAISGITSNEPDNGLGDGDTANDIGAIQGLTTSLRAERSGVGDGRIYTLTITCRDTAGNTSSAAVPVIVPKSQ